MNKNRDRTLLALCLILFGVLFLGANLGQYTFSFFWFMHTYWPILVIILGFHVLLQESKFWFLVPLLLIILTVWLTYYLSSQPSFNISPNFRQHFFYFKEGPFR
ncbi:LiaF transmembrane domain-containing protein [Halanaerobium salsuginis]|uniref:LiaF transmembrane domain-containing protein n=1 Tax=Halanaerobium salsuginis TaxID=29563 RepID=UPI000B7E7174|nr:DUF5668 domain-containing protein [Halanaerobium salsuginis]